MYNEPIDVALNWKSILNLNDDVCLIYIFAFATVVHFSSPEETTVWRNNCVKFENQTHHHLNIKYIV